MQDTLKLTVGQSDGNESVVPVRWCLDRKEAEHIVRHCGMAWILIAVVHEKVGEVARHLFPLDRVMEYIQFNRPGRHTLHATVVYVGTSASWVNTHEHHRRVRRDLLARSRPTQGNFGHRLFDNMGPGLMEFRPMWANEVSKSLQNVGECTVDVVVPDGFFAKERPAWLVKWAHLLWKRPYIDDCDFKKHLIFSWTAQPLLLPFVWGAKGIFAACSVLVKFVWALIALLLGVRSYPDYGINWSVVFTPFRGNPKDVWDMTFEPEVETNRGGLYTLYAPDGRPRPWYWLAFTPIVLFLLAVVGWILVGELGAYALLRIALFALIGAGVLGALIWVATFIVEKAVAILPDASSRRLRKAKRKAARLQKERAAFDKSLRPLVCDPTPTEVSLDALPPERQTIYLRFRRLKSKVCRPRAV